MSALAAGGTVSVTGVVRGAMATAVWGGMAMGWASRAVGSMATAHSTHWPSEVQPATMADNYFESRDGFSNFNEQQHQLLQFQNMSEDTGLRTGLSTGATSLLRGPIMAAKSAREEVMNSRATSNN